MFINLDAAVERRERIEASFRAHAPKEWVLRRMRAVDALEGAKHRGSIRPAAKGCFLSHIEAIRRTLQLPGDVLVVEDDAKFGPSSFAAIELLCSASAGWELLFTNVDMLAVPNWLWFANQYPRLRHKGQYALKDLAEIRFFGTLGYVIRESAKPKALNALASCGFDLAYDVRCNQLFRDRVLAGVLAFPFPLGLTEDADTSQIEPHETNSLSISGRILLRRMWFVDATPNDYRPSIDLLVGRMDEYAKAAGVALAAMLSEWQRRAALGKGQILCSASSRRVHRSRDSSARRSSRFRATRSL